MQSKTIAEQKLQIRKLKAALRVAVKYLKCDPDDSFADMVRRLEKLYE